MPTVSPLKIRQFDFTCVVRESAEIFTVDFGDNTKGRPVHYASSEQVAFSKGSEIIVHSDCEQETTGGLEGAKVIPFYPDPFAGVTVLLRQGKVVAAVDRIIEIVHALLSRGQYEDCDALLRGIKLNQNTPTQLVVTVLMATYPERENLARGPFVERARRWIQRYHRDREQALEIILK